MTKLATIRKQIAALEAEAERITKQEMSGAIAKVKEIMATFGLTIEHLQSAVVGRPRSVTKKVKPKRAGRGVAKYADPKTGKTWSGVGRAPAWIAGVKNRESFLVDKSGVKAPEPVVKAPTAKKKPAAKAALSGKVAKPAAKKRAAASKKALSKAAAPAAAKKRSAARKGAPKVAAKKSAKKRAAPGGAAGAPAAADGAAPSAT